MRLKRRLNLKVELNRVIAFVGLGNPGEKYLNTKHNAGFWVIGEWAKRHNLTFELGEGDYITARAWNGQQKKFKVDAISPFEYLLFGCGLRLRS